MGKTVFTASVWQVAAGGGFALGAWLLWAAGQPVLAVLSFVLALVLVGTALRLPS